MAPMLYKLSANRPTLEQKKLGPFTFNIEIKKSQPHQAEGLAQARGSSEDYGHLPGYIGPDGDSLDFFVGDRHDGQIYSYKKQQKLNERGERDPKAPWKTTDVKFVVGHGPDEAAKFHAGMAEWTTPTLRYVKDKSFRDWSALERHMNRHYKAASAYTGPLVQPGFLRGFSDSVFRPGDVPKVLRAFSDAEVWGPKGPVWRPRVRYHVGALTGTSTLLAGLAMSPFLLYRGGKRLYNKYTTPEDPTAEKAAMVRFGLDKAATDSTLYDHPVEAWLRARHEGVADWHMTKDLGREYLANKGSLDASQLWQGLENPSPDKDARQRFNAHYEAWAKSQSFSPAGVVSNPYVSSLWSFMSEPGARADVFEHPQGGAFLRYHFPSQRKDAASRTIYHSGQLFHPDKAALEQLRDAVLRDPHAHADKLDTFLTSRLPPAEGGKPPKLTDALSQLTSADLLEMHGLPAKRTTTDYPKPPTSSPPTSSPPTSSPPTSSPPTSPRWGRRAAIGAATAASLYGLYRAGRYLYDKYTRSSEEGNKMKTANDVGFFTGLRDGVGASMFRPISSVKYLVSPEGRYQLGLTAGVPALPAALAALSAYGLYRGGKYLYDKYTTPAPVAEETKLAASISARQRFGLLKTAKAAWQKRLESGAIGVKELGRLAQGASIPASGRGWVKNIRNQLSSFTTDLTPEQLVRYQKRVALTNPAYMKAHSVLPHNAPGSGPATVMTFMGPQVYTSPNAGTQIRGMVHSNPAVQTAASTVLASGKELPPWVQKRIARASDPVVTKGIVDHELAERRMLVGGALNKYPTTGFASHAGPDALIAERLGIRDPEAQQLFDKLRQLSPDDAAATALLKQHGMTPNSPIPLGGRAHRSLLGAVEHMPTGANALRLRAATSTPVYGETREKLEKYRRYAQTAERLLPQASPAVRSVQAIRENIEGVLAAPDRAQQLSPDQISYMLSRMSST